MTDLRRTHYLSKELVTPSLDSDVRSSFESRELWRGTDINVIIRVQLSAPTHRST